jgi:hypothetical protein
MLVPSCVFRHQLDLLLLLLLHCRPQAWRDSSCTPALPTALRCVAAGLTLQWLQPGGMHCSRDWPSSGSTWREGIHDAVSPIISDDGYYILRWCVSLGSHIQCVWMRRWKWEGICAACACDCTACVWASILQTSSCGQFTVLGHLSSDTVMACAQ